MALYAGSSQDSYSVMSCARRPPHDSCECYGYRHIVDKYVDRYTYTRTVTPASRLLASPCESAVQVVFLLIQP